MISRISAPGSFISGAIKYNTDKVELGGATLIANRNFNVGGGVAVDSATAIPLMLAQINKNSRIEKPVFCCNLDLNHEDLNRISTLVGKNDCGTKDGLYNKIAEEYMKGMGYGNQPYLVYRHNDIDREHIHIVSIRVDSEGNKISNYNEHLRSERVRAEINEKFGLSTKGEIKGKELNEVQQITLAESRYDFMNRTRKSISAYNEAVKTWSEIAAPNKKEMIVKEHQANLFHHISNALKYVNENYQPKDLKEYNKILSQFNIICKKSEGDSTDGKHYTGCQYAVLDEKGDICSHLMKGSSFGKSYSLVGLEKRFALANSSKSMLENADFSRDFIKKNIDLVLNAPHKIEFEDITTQLRDHGITTNLIKNHDNTDKIIGINFIDNINGTTFNGNNLGKSYSYSNLSKSIEQHNRTIEKQSNNNSFVPKEQFNDAVKLLNTEFNRYRKEEYYLESDAIRSIKNRQPKLEELLQTSLLFTPAQAQRTVNRFRENKEINLETVDFNESSYQQKQITAAVQFAQHIPDEQNRIDFLQKSGVYVSRKYDSLQFTSAFKESVSLSFEQICDRTANSLEPVSNKNLPFNPHNIPEPSDDIERLSKSERQFVNSFVNHDNKKVSGDFTNIALLLDKEEQTKASSKLFVEKEEFLKHLKSLEACTRNIMRTGSYKYKTDLCNNIDNHKDAYIDTLLNNGCNNIKAESIYNIYKAGAQRNIPKFAEDEKNVAVNRILSASIFARHISNPADKSEFLMRMGIHAEVNNGVLTLSREDHRDYSITWNELMKRDERLTRDNQLFFDAVPAPTNPNAKLFTKKERDFINSYSADNLMSDRPDARNASAVNYLNDKEKLRALRLCSGGRINEILDRNVNASILNVTKALWTRGFVVKPFEENGQTIFKAGMHFSKDELFIALPFSYQERLRNTHYEKAYPTMNKLVLNGNWDSPKMETLKSITRAADYNDVKLLNETIDEVAKTNRILAKSMKDAMGSTSSPDYERVANLVFNYQGEKTIILPPPTDKNNSFVKTKIPAEVKDKGVNNNSYEEMLEFLKTGTYLEYMQSQAHKIIEQREENQHKGKNIR